jgi:hypothetical protein
VDFVDGSILTENELDESYKHNLFIGQEASEGQGGEQLTKKGLEHYDAEGNKIINLFTPSENTDAANKAYVDDSIDTAIALGGSPAIVSLGGYDVTALGSSEPRSLANRFSDVVNVLDYGAYNDGTNGTATTTAFNNALLAADGKALEIPPGTYLIESTLNISKYTNNKPKYIYGGGGLSYNGTGACIRLDGSIIVDDIRYSFQRLTIQNISIGRAATNSNTNLIGLHLDGGTVETSRVNVYNVLIAGFNTTDSIGLKLQRCWVNAFYGCELFENYIGINLNNTSNQNAFFGCKINNNDNHGVLFNSSSVSTLISGSEIEANGAAGIKVEGQTCVGLTVDSCYFESNTTYDVHLNASNTVGTDLRNNFHEMKSSASGVFYGEAHSDLYISGFFQSSDANETTSGFKTTGNGQNITRGNTHLNGWSNGANFYDLDPATKIVSIDNGSISSNGGINGDNIKTSPSNADLTYSFITDPQTISGQTNCNVRVLTKSLEITHTNGVTTNTDFKIHAQADAQGWVACYVMYTFNHKSGQPSNYYGANWSIGGHSDNGTAWTTAYSSLLHSMFATGGGHTASAVVDGDGDLCFRHTITSPIPSTIGVGTVTVLFSRSTV